MNTKPKSKFLALFQGTILLSLLAGPAVAQDKDGPRDVPAGTQPRFDLSTLKPFTDGVPYLNHTKQFIFIQ